MILRARFLFPILGPPIENGAVVISGNRIKEVGPLKSVNCRPRGRVVDLGEVVLMPGLVNAHCHLDYTSMGGEFPSPKNFIDWLKSITATKAGWNAAEYSSSWLEGARMLLRTGTTTVCDIEAVPQLLPDVWNSTALRVISLLEMIGITKRRLPHAVLNEALQFISPLGHQRCSAGLSPHAPYSTVAPLLASSAKIARRKGWPLCTHVAESHSEFEMFARARGDMFEWLRKSGREMSDCGLGSPVRHLDRCGLLMPNLIAAHCNYLARGDAALLAQRGVSVVHCPRSHAYFQHASFPLSRLLRAGVNVCLGTDSLASVIKSRKQPIELDMFAEMRSFADQHRDLKPKTVLQMASIHGASALGRAGVIGALSKNYLADLIALPLSAPRSRIAKAILEYDGHVAASMIDGQWAIPPS